MARGNHPKEGLHLQSPKGTRDFYPEDLLRRRYITETWRGVSIRHGFEEIDGPTFEHLDLYTIKSGDGIVSELFSFTRAGGEDTYALRPEFTPTLARMYGARAKQMPKPVRWFCIPTFFRAEKPQRGRLREFLQWNVDVIGDETLDADISLWAIGALALESFGIKQDGSVLIQFNNRQILENGLRSSGIDESKWGDAFRLFDLEKKLPDEEWNRRLTELGIDQEVLGKIFIGPHTGSDQRC